VPLWVPALKTAALPLGESEPIEEDHESKGHGTADEPERETAVQEAVIVEEEPACVLTGEGESEQ
jgi:hypothetical protein